jgi:hypothetical protein
MFMELCLVSSGIPNNPSTHFSVSRTLSTVPSNKGHSKVSEKPYSCAGGGDNIDTWARSSDILAEDFVNLLSPSRKEPEKYNDCLLPYSYQLITHEASYHVRHISELIKAILNMSVLNNSCLVLTYLN